MLFRGESAMYKFNGELLAVSPSAADSVIVADMDYLNTRNKMFNSVNDIFADRRPDMYE